MYTIATVLSVLALVTVMTGTTINLICIAIEEDQELNCLDYAFSFSTRKNLNGTCFGLNSLALLVTSYALYITMRDINKQSMSIVKQVKVLVCIFTVFTLAYGTRAIWDFSTAELQLTFSNIFTEFTFPLLWDFLPIAMMLCFHFHEVRNV